MLTKEVVLGHYIYCYLSVQPLMAILAATSDGRRRIFDGGFHEMGVKFQTKDTRDLDTVPQDFLCSHKLYLCLCSISVKWGHSSLCLSCVFRL